MQAFVAILSIALVVVVSVGASIPRAKRGAAFSSKSPGVYEAMQDLVNGQKTIALAVLKEVPSTAAYAKYKKELEDFLKTYDETKKGENCFEKMQRLMEGYSDFFPKYKGPKATAEGKEIWRLFEKHGINELVERNAKIIANADEDDIDVEKMTKMC